MLDKQNCSGVVGNTSKIQNIGMRVMLLNGTEMLLPPGQFVNFDGLTDQNPVQLVEFIELTGESDKAVAKGKQLEIKGTEWTPDESEVPHVDR